MYCVNTEKLLFCIKNIMKNNNYNVLSRSKVFDDSINLSE